MLIMDLSRKRNIHFNNNEREPLALELNLIHSS